MMTNPKVNKNEDSIFGIDFGYSDAHHLDEGDTVAFTNKLLNVLCYEITKRNGSKVMNVDGYDGYIKAAREHALSMHCLDNDMLLRIAVLSCLYMLSDSRFKEEILIGFIPKIHLIAKRFENLTPRVIGEVEYNFKDVLAVIRTDDAQYKVIKRIVESFVKTIPVI